jgi:hypothetical protein
MAEPEKTLVHVDGVGWVTPAEVPAALVFAGKNISDLVDAPVVDAAIPEGE